MKLIPVELSYGKHYIFLVPAVFIILSGLSSKGYSMDLAYSAGLRSVFNLLTAYLAGLSITPVLLPWIPFRRFALQGLLVGWIATLILYFFCMTGTGILETVSWFLMTGGLSSFLAMNYTGTSTFTSLSGVQKEMKTALPAQIILTGIGFIAWITSRFIVF
jgi:hypothetical protein